jgi:hypothetical protein
MNKTMNIDDDATMKDQDIGPGFSGDKVILEANETMEPVPDTGQGEEAAGEGMNLTNHKEDEEVTEEANEKNKSSNNTTTTDREHITDKEAANTDNETAGTENSMMNNQQEDGWNLVPERKTQRGARTTPTTYYNTGKFGEEDNGSVYRLGMRMSRFGPMKKTGWKSKEIAKFFRLIEKIDPAATIFNYANQSTSGTPIKDVSAIKNCKEYFDICTTNWGNPSDKKDRTVWSCYIQSKVLRPGFRDLRDDDHIQAILKDGNCVLHHHSLSQSQVVAVGYVFGKNPKHTHRRELEDRLQRYFSEAVPDETVPSFQIEPSRVNIGKAQLNMCTIFVGKKDETKMTNLLNDHPSCSGIEIVLHQLRKTKAKEFVERMQQHKVIVDNSRAFKLEHVTEKQLSFLEMGRTNDDLTSRVIDIARAGHFQQSGVVYVQYLQQHKDEVATWIESKLQAMASIDSEQLHKPQLASTTDSVAPTLATSATKDRPFPASSFECLFREGGTFHGNAALVNNDSIAKQNSTSNQAKDKQMSWIDAILNKTNAESPASSVTETQDNRSKHSKLSAETLRKAEEYDSVVAENKQLKEVHESVVEENKQLKDDNHELRAICKQLREDREASQLRFATLEEQVAMLTKQLAQVLGGNPSQEGASMATQRPSGTRKRASLPQPPARPPDTSMRPSPTKPPTQKRSDVKATPPKPPPPPLSPTVEATSPQPVALFTQPPSDDSPQFSLGQSTAARDKKHV